MAVGNCNGPEAPTKNIAVIFGATGLVGKELVKKLLSKPRWKVYGVARRADQALSKLIQNPNYQFISCDLLNLIETKQKLSSLREVTHLFWVTWASQFPLDSQECCDQNKAMMENALNAILPRTSSLKHVSLQTGAKHYVSIGSGFQEGGLGFLYGEDSPRVGGGRNFYYALEDLLRLRLAAGNVAWSVHRPGLIMGSSVRTLFNFMGSLCVYGAICRHLNLPFLFGGTRRCWEEMYIDGSDAGLVAEQHIWAAINDKIYSSDGQALNAINGDSFTWREIWRAMAMKLGAEVPEEMFSEDFVFSEAMGDKGEVWKEIVKKEELVETEMGDLANWEFVDQLFRCPMKMTASREKADRLGFQARCDDTLECVLYWVDRMRDERLIPWKGL